MPFQDMTAEQKKSTIGLAVLLIAVVAIGAQQLLARGKAVAREETARPAMATPEARQQRQQELMDETAAQLELTPEQRSRIEGIVEEARGQMQQMRGNDQVAPEQRRESFAAVRQAAEQQIVAVLTPAQQTKLQQLRAESPGFGNFGLRGGRVGRPGGGPGGQGWDGPRDGRGGGPGGGQSRRPDEQGQPPGQ